MVPKATDEESPIYDYCMVLAECRADEVQSAELRVKRVERGVKFHAALFSFVVSVCFYSKLIV